MSKPKPKAAKSAVKKKGAAKSARAKTAKAPKAPKAAKAARVSKTPKAPKVAKTVAPKPAEPAATKVGPKKAAAKASADAVPTKPVAVRAPKIAAAAAPAPRDDAPAAAQMPLPFEPVGPATDEAAVDAFLRDCDHPLKDAFDAARKLILAASSSISEGIKWNAPSFRTTEWFATFFLREPDMVKIVFHLGAKKTENSRRLQVGAPEGMVEWLANDRCMVTLDGAEGVKRRGKALQAFVRAWVLHL